MLLERDGVWKEKGRKFVVFSEKEMLITLKKMRGEKASLLPSFLKRGRDDDQNW